jgi:hypothetical protein
MQCDGLIWFMVFNATFNNISVKSWRSVLLMEETGENHWPATSLGQMHIIHLGISGILTHNFSGDSY